MSWDVTHINGNIQVTRKNRVLGIYKTLKEPFCKICSNSDFTETCRWHDELYGFHRIYTLGKYQTLSEGADPLSAHIVWFKKRRSWAIPLGKAMSIELSKNYPELQDSDFLVPVPLHQDKLNSRGYNQALELANVISRELSIQVKELLVKNMNIEMRGLSRIERLEVVKGMYSISDFSPELIKNKSIILIDDVVTSGSTASECSKLIINAGANIVNVYAVGRRKEKQWD